MEDYIKKPCQHCPFKLDVTPFLHPERAEEIAYAAQNPYNTFPCHKTTSHDDDGNAECNGREQECAGFLTLRAQELGEEYVPEGFKPSYDLVYSDAHEMVDAYHEAWV